MSFSPSAKLDVVKRWLTAVDTWDLNGIYALLADDLQVEIFPASLGKHKMNLEQYKKYIETQLASFTGLKTVILDVVESSDRLVTHIKAVSLHSGTNHEFILTFNFAGDKISAIRVFLDTAPAAELRLDERER